MKVLLTSTLYPTPQAPKIVGGAEIFARRFAEGLAQRGDEVEVIRAASSPGQARESCNGIDIYSAPVQNVYLPFTEQKNVASSRPEERARLQQTLDAHRAALAAKPALAQEQGAVSDEMKKRLEALGYAH